MSATQRPIVFVTRGIPPPAADLLREHVDLRVWSQDREMTPEEIRQAVPGIHGLLVHPPTMVDKTILDAAGPQLKVVGTMSVGLEHIDLRECASRKIAVGHTPDVLTDATAELTVALTLSTCRRFKEVLTQQSLGLLDTLYGVNSNAKLHDKLRNLLCVHDLDVSYLEIVNTEFSLDEVDAFDAVVNGGWGTWDNAQYLCGKEVKNSVIGIVGMGRIGFATAQRLKAFKPSRILYSGNGPKEYAQEFDAEYVTFDDLLRESDFVIVCLSVNLGNVGLFNAEAFKKMKKSAIFINTSRGVVVNQDDLYKALTLGQLYAAGLDVTTPEPLLQDNPLLTLPNVIVTPHIGSATERARGAMAELTARNILAGIKGDPLPSPVHM